MVVDDDPSMCSFLQAFLAERGYQAVALGSAEEAVRRYTAERPAAVILDVVMPGAMDGLGALAAFKKIDREVPIIVLSGQGRTTTVVQAMKLGASDFVSKPFDEHDLEVPLLNALRQSQLSHEVASLREQLQSQSKHKMLFGNSEQMAEVCDLIERVADTDVTVLIRGESGTGKELVARALSASSLRRDKPFVKVNCAALPTELLESELFGFERGAFTGAIQHKPGKFEFANHGTMFLDEIGDMSFPLQAKLLQVLQDGEFSRLGGKHDVRVDVRVIAATNRDIEKAVAEGHFREDLFFRLNVFPINLPPLRERRDDVPMLMSHFLQHYCAKHGRNVPGFTQAALRTLLNYDYPGNIRELQNLVERAVIVVPEGELVDVHHVLTSGEKLDKPVLSVRMAGESSGRLGDDGVTASPPAPVESRAPLAGTLAEVEEALMRQALAQARGNISAAARKLGITRPQLAYRMKRLGVGETTPPR
jgi:two-component system, NtrC family, response regulator HydG